MARALYGTASKRIYKSIKFAGECVRSFLGVYSEGVELTIGEMANGTVCLKRSDRPHEMMCISIDYFMDRLK